MDCLAAAAKQDRLGKWTSARATACALAPPPAAPASGRTGEARRRATRSAAGTISPGAPSRGRAVPRTPSASAKFLSSCCGGGGARCAPEPRTARTGPSMTSAGARALCSAATPGATAPCALPPWGCQSGERSVANSSAWTPVPWPRALAVLGSGSQDSGVQEVLTSTWPRSAPTRVPSR